MIHQLHHCNGWNRWASCDHTNNVATTIIAHAQKHVVLSSPFPKTPVDSHRQKMGALAFGKEHTSLTLLIMGSDLCVWLGECVKVLRSNCWSGRT